MNNLETALLFILNSGFNLILLAVMLRFTLHLVDANFYHPISQMVVSLSDPIVRPIKRFIPMMGNICIGCLFSAFVLCFAKHALFAYVYMPKLGTFFTITFLSLSEIMVQFVNIFFWSTIIRVALSWMSVHSNNPLSEIVIKISDPALKIAKKILPPQKGFDFSPVLVIAVLEVIKILLPK